MGRLQEVFRVMKTKASQKSRIGLEKSIGAKGIATWALKEFLAHHNQARPIYARVAKDNLGSRRVLEKCGFTIIGESKGFANARGLEIEELLLELAE
jgi:RimJ/RimL family protein N-acetyltransferase